MNKFNGSEQMDKQTLKSVKDLDSLSQVIVISSNGGKSRAKVHEDNAPMREIKEPKLGTLAARETKNNNNILKC